MSDELRPHQYLDELDEVLESANTPRHADSCMYRYGADCDCGLTERLDEMARLEQERAEPTDQYLIDRAIHDDHAQGNEEPF